MSKKVQNTSTKNVLKRGSLSVVYTLIFVVLIIAVNLVVSSIAGSVNLNVDLTAEEFISIGQVSRNVLGDLEEKGELEATIYMLAPRAQYDNGGTELKGLNVIALVRDLCEEYAYTYGGIKVEYKDLNRDPEWANQYNKITNTVLNQDNIIVEGKYHARVLSLSSFFTVDSESGEYVGFNGELRLTTALMQSCMSQKQVVAFTKGHNEPAQLADGKACTQLSYLLTNAGFEVKEIDLAREELKVDEVNVLFINNPTQDFTNEEIDKLADYTKEFGNLIVTVDDKTPVLPALSDYLEEEWGMGYKANHQLSHLTANFNTNPLNLSAKIVSDMENPENSAAYQLVKNLLNVRLIAPNSVELYTKPVSTKDDYMVETVLTTDSDATSTHVSGGTSTDGKFPLMLLSANSDYVDLEDENSTNQVRKYQYVMLVGSTDFVGSVNDAKFGNGNLLLSALRTMAVERYSLDIDYKAINDVALAIETEDATRLGVIICAVLPVACLVVGLVVFIRRRHL